MTGRFGGPAIFFAQEQLLEWESELSASGRSRLTLR
jgi:hypothetical protein